jgi:hypothetical protein
VQQVDEGSVPVGRGEIGLEPDGLTEAGDGLVPLGLVLVDQRQVIPGFGVTGLKPDGLTQAGGGLRGPADVLQGAAQVVVSFVKVGPQPDDFAETLRSTDQISTVAQQVAQVVPRPHQGGAQPQGHAVGLDRFPLFLPRPQHLAQIEVRFGEIRFQTDCSQETVGGRLELACIDVDPTEVVPGRNQVRLDLQGPAIEGRGLGRLPEGLINEPRVVAGLVQSGVQAERLAVAGQGIVQTAGGVVCVRLPQPGCGVVRRCRRALHGCRRAHGRPRRIAMDLPETTPV